MYELRLSVGLGEDAYYYSSSFLSAVHMERAFLDFGCTVVWCVPAPWVGRSID